MPKYTGFQKHKGEWIAVRTNVDEDGIHDSRELTWVCNDVVASEPAVLDAKCCDDTDRIVEAIDRLRGSLETGMQMIATEQAVATKAIDRNTRALLTLGIGIATQTDGTVQYMRDQLAVLDKGK